MNTTIDNSELPNAGDMSPPRKSKLQRSIIPVHIPERNVIDVNICCIDGLRIQVSGINPADVDKTVDTILSKWGNKTNNNQVQIPLPSSLPSPFVESSTNNSQHQEDIQKMKEYLKDIQMYKESVIFLQKQLFALTQQVHAQQAQIQSLESQKTYQVPMSNPWTWSSVTNTQ
jgi:hypothetical protein